MERTSLERARGAKQQLRVLFWGVVAVGVAWRLLRYALRMPVWGDEAFVGLNVIDRDWWGLTMPLAHSQVAPVFFLWMERAAAVALGTSEYAMRAGPVLAGVAAVGLMAWWARLLLRPMGAALAVGFFAVGYYVVRHAVEIKPYSVDALMALGLLAPATWWWKGANSASKKHILALWGLAATVPVAIGFSYPAVFVTGAVSVALLPAVWRAKRAATWVAFGMFNSALVGSFVVMFVVATRGQYAETGEFMRRYWHESFPPGNFLGALGWLVKVHAGEMMAYPVGGQHGGSTGTLALVVIGAAALWRGERRLGRWELLVLLLGPFGLTLVAAAMQRYPYGGSARVAQHLAPAICLMAGAGIEALLAGLLRSRAQRQLVFAGVMWALVGIGVGGMIRDVAKPYKTPADGQARRTVEGAFRAGERVIVAQAMADVPVNYEWYLRRDGARVTWNAEKNAGLGTFVDGEGLVYLMNFSRGLKLEDMGAFKALTDAGWKVEAQRVEELQIGPKEEGPAYCEWVGMQHGK